MEWTGNMYGFYTDKSVDDVWFSLIKNYHLLIINMNKVVLEMKSFYFVIKTMKCEIIMRIMVTI